MFRIHEAREQFLSEGTLDRKHADVVRPDILVSWRRSRLSGASMLVDSLPHRTDKSDLNTANALCRAAEPVLSRLAEQLSGLQAGVLVADRQARILRRWAPQNNILMKMDRIASDTGGSGSEELVGTNGIGSIVEDRKAHMVVGPEHFADVLSGFCCVGAPIFNPLNRKFEGVVTLNADADAASPLLTSLIASTAQEIESRLLDQSSRRERALLDAYLIATKSGRPIAVVSEDVMLAGSRVSHVLRSLDQRVLWEQIRDAVSSRRPDHMVMVRTDDDLASLTYTPIHLDDRLIGALVELIPTHLAPRPVMAPVHPDSWTGWSGGAQLLPGSSEAWQAVLRRAATQRAATVPLLLVGERGTGKAELAKAMFADRSVSVVDCLAVGETTWASSLGERAEEGGAGVLLLRHVDALEPAAASSLSVRLDELAALRPSIRIVATASSAEEWADAPGRRRLHDQLGVVTIELPPLRDRIEDIPELVKQLVDRYCGLTPLRFSQAALRALSRAPWPGNIRQLENVVRALADTHHAREITPELLPDGLGAFSAARTLTRMEQLEMKAIIEAVTATNGNKVEMAKLLGISRSTLYRKMRHYRVDLDIVAT